MMITWLVVGFVVGAAVAAFWDKIKEWATKMWSIIMTTVNKLIEVVSDALVYVIKEGSSYYKQVKVFVMNKTGQIRVESRRQEVSSFETPSDILQSLERKRELLIMRTGG